MATLKIPEQKVILCGEYGVGKSSLFRRFTNNTFVAATDRQSTLGLDHFHKIYTVADRDIKVGHLYLHYFNYFCTMFKIFLVATLGYWWNGKSCFNYIKLL